MQFALTDRGRRACLFAVVMAAVLVVAAWWPASRHEGVMLTPAAMRAMGDPAPVVVTSNQQPAPAPAPVVIEAAKPVAAPAPPVVPSVPQVPSVPPVEQPVFQEGEAPWDLAPPFRH